MVGGFAQKIFVGIAVVLLASFVVHAIVLEHDHPHDLFGDGVQAFLHGDHKKWWLFAVSLCLFLFSVRRGLFHVQILGQGLHTKYSLLVYRGRSVFDTMQKIFREGILHPKLCAR
jgi:hypothetical protein